MRLLIASVFLMACQPVFAFSIPPYQQTSPGGDEVRARDGTSCRMGQHPTPVVDMGVSGGNNPYGMGNGYYAANQFGNQQQMRAEVYGRIVIPLQVSGIERVDCNRLYELEVERLQIEIELLKKGQQGGIQVE